MAPGRHRRIQGYISLLGLVNEVRIRLIILRVYGETTSAVFENPYIEKQDFKLLTRAFSRLLYNPAAPVLIEDRRLLGFETNRPAPKIHNFPDVLRGPLLGLLKEQINKSKLPTTKN